MKKISLFFGYSAKIEKVSLVVGKPSNVTNTTRMRLILDLQNIALNSAVDQNWFRYLVF